jgi:alkylation response protein AidB-like acyl-CoA dehydrogenase
MELDRRIGEDPTYFDWGLVRAGLEYRMLSEVIPTQVGGGGGLAVNGAALLEELAVACPGVANLFGAHALGILPLVLSGPGHWVGVLREIAEAERRGEPLLMACAITEPEAGTDVEDPELLRTARIGSHARRVAGGYRLSGTKRFISNGNVARWITVIMPTDPHHPAETWTAFLVDTGSDGFSAGRIEHKMGQRASPAAELLFDDVFVADEAVVGREGDGIAGMVGTLAASRAPVAAIATGIARGAYERLLDWLEHDPHARGLLQRDHVQLTLAQMTEEIHLARLAYLSAAEQFDRTVHPALAHPLVRALSLVPSVAWRYNMPRRAMSIPWVRDETITVLRHTTTDRKVTESLAHSSMAKAHCADVAMRVTGAALDIAGLEAGPVRAELEKLWRDAKLTQIYEGTNQLNRLTVYHGLCLGETLPALPLPVGSDARTAGGAR